MARRCRSSIAIVLAALSCTLARLPGQQANGGAESISPLIQALVDDNVTLANVLLDAGADVATLDTITPLYAAQEYVSKRKARHAMLRKLLAAGSQVDQATQDGTTTLMLAAYNGAVLTHKCPCAHPNPNSNPSPNPSPHPHQVTCDRPRSYWTTAPTLSSPTTWTRTPSWPPAREGTTSWRSSYESMWASRARGTTAVGTPRRSSCDAGCDRCTVYNGCAWWRLVSPY